MTAACPAAVELESFARGALPDDDLELIADHLGTCQRCEAEIATWSQKNPLDQMLRGLQGESIPAETTLELGRRLGEYVLLGPLGTGGMGRVFQAIHSRLDKVVAIKMLASHRVRDRGALARFEREMTAAGRLDHPNIVRALDAGEADGTPYLAMEYVDGIDTARLVADSGPLSVANAAEMGRQAAQALAAAHAAGIIHRDVKPANLMLATDGCVKLLDLGLALESAGEYLTTSGALMGTAAFMAPEQAENAHAIDARADLYSLGCTLYYWLAATPPFGGAEYTSPLKLLRGHAEESPAPIRDYRPDVPPALAGILDRLLAKKPSDRFGSADEVVAALAPFADGADLGSVGAFAAGEIEPRTPPRRRRRRPRPLAAGVALVVIAGLITYFALNKKPSSTDDTGPLIVTSLDDDPREGLLTLREALERASGTERTITLPAEGTITLKRELPVPAGNTEILVPKAGRLTIQPAEGAGPMRLLSVPADGTLQMNNVTLRGFRGRDGGAIANQGHLTLSFVDIRECSAERHGGAVFNTGTLVLEFSTFAANSAGEWAGALYSTGKVSADHCTFADNTGGSHGGAVYSSGSLSLSSCTISGNRTARWGGGLVCDGGSTLLSSCTLTNNRADFLGVAGSRGGGIRCFNVAGIRLFNTICAGNHAGLERTSIPDDVSVIGVKLEGRHNLLGVSPSDSGFRHGVDGNRLGSAEQPLDPQLGPLADNGGSTRTHLPAPASPAIDAGDREFAIRFDQRSLPRIVNAGNDIGAVERQKTEKTPAP